MPWNCYNYSPIILTATIDLLPFAVILHNKNNVCDIFNTGKLMKEINTSMTRNISLCFRPQGLSTYGGGPCHAMPSTGSSSMPCWSTAAHPGPPSSYKHHSRLWYNSKVCNLCFSIKPAVFTNTDTFHSIQVYIWEKSLDSFLSASSTPFLLPFP